MLTKTNKPKRLLAALLAALVLSGLCAITVLAEGDGTADSSSITSVFEPVQTEDTSLPEEEEAGDDITQEGEPEQDEDAAEDEISAASPAAAPLALPTVSHSGITSYAGFAAALTDIVDNHGGVGHIQIAADIRLPDTVEIGAGVNLTLSGATGTEKLLLETGLDATRHFRVEGALTLGNVDINGETRGGGIHAVGAALVIEEGTRIGNCERYAVDQYGSTFVAGGGIYAIGGTTIDMYGGVIEENATYYPYSYPGTEKGGGGGVYIGGYSVFNMYGGIFRNNLASNSRIGEYAYYPMHGGAVFVYCSTFVMHDGEMSGNQAFSGSAIFGHGQYLTDDCYVDILGGVITGNGWKGPLNIIPDSFEPAGAVTGYHTYLTIKNAEFSYNDAYTGGAVTFTPTGQGELLIEDSVFHHNTGVQGGAVYFQPYSEKAVIRGTEFYLNHATNDPSAGYGGAIFVAGESYRGTSFTLEDCTFTENSAYGFGGAIYAYGAGSYDTINCLYLDGVTFRDNYTIGSNPSYFNTAHATVYGTNVTDTQELSFPFHLDYDDSTRLNKAYNNYDVWASSVDPVDVFTVEIYVDGAWQYNILVPENLHMFEPDRIEVPTGYILDGWYTDPDVGNPAYEWIFSTMTVDDDMELYAELKLDPFAVLNDVLYYRNYTGGDDTIIHTEDDVVETALLTPYAPPDREGHTFLGWAEARDESDPNNYWHYATDPMPGHELKLYAQWEVNVYEVTFDYSQVYAAPGNTHKESVPYNGTLPQMNTTMAGYTFKGWWYTAAGRYWVFGTDKMPAGDITLVGHWTQNTTTPPTPSENSSSTGGGGTNPPDSSSSSPTSSRPASSSSTPPAAIASSSSSSAVAPVASSSAPPSSQPVENEYGQQDLDTTDVPLNWWQRGDGWSLLNLLVSILLLLSAVFQLVRMALARRRREDGYGDEGVQGKRRLWTILSAITGIPPILLLFLLEDFSGAMMLLDKWSLWFIGFAVLHAACTLVALTRKARWKQNE